MSKEALKEMLGQRIDTSKLDKTFNSMFGIDESYQITMLPTEKLITIDNQPFSPYTDEELGILAEDIAEYGLQNPVLVRPMPDGNYKVLAGRNRRNACAMLGMKTIPSRIKECDDYTAEMILLTSNLIQRRRYKPSELAFAYKRRMELIKRQGKRTDLEDQEASTQVAWKRESAQKIAEQTQTSRDDNGYVLDTNAYTATLSGVQGTADIVYAPNVTIAEQPQVGRINIVKSNSTPTMGDYSLAGAVFDIRNSSGILVDTLKTDENGKAQSKELKLGDYTVTEKSAPYGYARNTGSFSVSLTYGGQDVSTVYGTASIPERPQTGIIQIHKQNTNPNMGDYALNGAVFEIRAAADIKQTNGTVIYNKGDLADTITTNSSGEAQTKELPLGTYIVTEKTSPYGFVLNTNSYISTLSYAGQEISVAYTNVTVPENPQTGTISITKLDKETGARAQGDSTLNGAVFELYAAEDVKKLDGSNIYHKDQLVETLYCGTNSSATSKELPLGTYYYKEKVAPVGYTLDANSYTVKIEYAGQNVAVTKKYGDLKNKVIEGQIALVKHTDQADPDVDPANSQIEKPLEGAVFNIWLKSAGSYDNSLPSERDQIVTDADGYAKTKQLPYGVYTVQEIYAPGDVKLVDSFDVFISSDGKVYRYILNDPSFTSLVKIVKVDAETGKTVPVAGTSFKVWDVANNKWVSQSFNYPTPTTIDVFETSADGTLVMPEALLSDDYSLYEVSAPYGYVLAKNPVKFTIHSTQSDPEIIEVIMANNPAKGVITVEKKGDMLTDVTVTDTTFGKQYTPIFSLTGLKGAVFNVIAAEDIYTPDGTLRYAAGTMVDTITSDGNGHAESKQLYLGNYSVVEITAPEGFVLDETLHPVSLVYEGQEVAVVSSQIGISNTRQTVEIELQKLMENPVGASDDFSAFQDVVFGLFADEDIRDASGNIVMLKDSLVALMTLDDDGKGVIKGELPLAKYYVQEVQTNIYYQLNSTKYPVNAEYQGQDVAVAKIQVNNGGVAIPNETKLGRITIEKTGEILVGATESSVNDGTMYTPVYETKYLSGAVFDVIADEDIYDVYDQLIHKKGDIVDTVTTGSDGKATTKLLHLGRYRLVETETPYGCVKCDDEVVTLGFNGQVTDIITTQVSVYNERQKAEVNLTKYCEIPKEAAADYNPYSSIVFALMTKEDIKTSDGTVVIPANSLLEYIYVGKDGKAEIKTDLPFGSYYIQEIISAVGYVVDENKYDISFDYTGPDNTVVTIEVNNGKPIANELQRGSLKIIKTFEGRKTPIAGVPFTITGKTLVGTDVTINAVTDENGEIFIENLLTGSYTVKELDSDLTVGYILSPADNAVVAHDEIAEMTINNKLQRGDLKIIKIFEGKTTPIKGAKFTVTGLSVTGISFSGEFETDENGEILIEGLPIGEYKVLELASDLTTGYVLSEEQTAIVASDEITKMTIDNRLIRGQIKIFKYDETNNSPIQGAVFGIYNEKGELVQEITSDADGYAVSEWLEYGKYQIIELSSAEGYLLDQTPYELEITEDKKVYELSFKNNPIPDEPENPKTGDNSNIWLWLSAIGVSIGGLVLAIKKSRIAGKSLKTK